MTFIQAVFLALLQGIGEFLPISSSGHIVIFKKIFLNAKSLDFLTNGGLEVFLHIASLFSILLYFRKELIDIFFSIFKKKSYVEFINIIIATIPTGIIGIIIKKSQLDIFNSMYLVLFDLFLTGIILFSTGFIHKNGSDEISKLQSFVIGILQGIAVLPGISRSGLTISGSLHCGINRKKSANFSFLILIPALFGAIILDFKELASIKFDLNIWICFIFTFGFGILALKILFGIINKNWFKYFGYYCVAVSVVGFVLTR